MPPYRQPTTGQAPQQPRPIPQGHDKQDDVTPFPQGPTTTHGGSSGSGDPMPATVQPPTGRFPVAKLAPKLPPKQGGQPTKRKPKDWQASLLTQEEHDKKADAQARYLAIAREAARAATDLSRAEAEAN